MNKIFYLFLMVLLVLTSCEEYVTQETIKGEAPLLVVNAILDTQSEEHSVELAMTGSSSSVGVFDAQVTLSVNGVQVSESDGDDSPYYSLHAKLQPKDIVTVHAKSGKYHATSTIEVPTPIEIMGLDTMIYENQSTAETTVRYLIHIKQPEGVSGTQYYRLVVSDSCWNDYVLEIDNKDYTIKQIQRDENPSVDHGYDYTKDPALSGNSTQMNDDNSLIESDFLNSPPNSFGIFRSSSFKNGEYTLRIEKPLEERSTYWAKVERKIAFRIYSIPREEYLYLNALSALNYFGEFSLSSNAPIVPSNIKGGTGLFSVDAVSEIVITDGYENYKVGDVYQEYYYQDGYNEYDEDLENNYYDE